MHASYIMDDWSFLTYTLICNKNDKKLGKNWLNTSSREVLVCRFDFSPEYT